jgi:hypothetical protein
MLVNGTCIFLCCLLSFCDIFMLFHIVCMTGDNVPMLLHVISHYFIITSCYVTLLHVTLHYSMVFCGIPMLFNVSYVTTCHDMLVHVVCIMWLSCYWHAPSMLLQYYYHTTIMTIAGCYHATIMLLLCYYHVFSIWYNNASTLLLWPCHHDIIVLLVQW